MEHFYWRKFMNVNITETYHGSNHYLVSPESLPANVDDVFASTKEAAAELYVSYVYGTDEQGLAEVLPIDLFVTPDNGDIHKLTVTFTNCELVVTPSRNQND